MTFKHNNLIFILLMSIFSSCISNKKIIYLQNQEGQEAIIENELITYKIPQYRVQFNDILDIQIQTVDDLIENGFRASAQANVAGNQMIGQVAQGGGDIFYMTGYKVNNEGFIRMPLIGEIKVDQMTVDEIRLKVENKIRDYVTSELFVSVKLGGIRFSTLGEFRRPGKYVVLQDRLTIFEAIAQSGDLTTVAKRDELMLLRQYPDGTKIHMINLNDRNIIHSPFYFIQPSDQLYVQPMKIREIGAGENASQSLALIISSISAVALVLNLIN